MSFDKDMRAVLEKHGLTKEAQAEVMDMIKEEIEYQVENAQGDYDEGHSDGYIEARAEFKADTENLRTAFQLIPTDPVSARVYLERATQTYSKDIAPWL
jgi:hypothetical protein